MKRPNRRRIPREEVRLWLADSDDAYRVAQQNFGLGNYHVAAFYVHSAVERALKAAVIGLKLESPAKTHDLKRLYSRVAGDIKLSQEQIDFLGELTPVSQTARYVDVAVAMPRDVYSRTLAERYLSAAAPVLTAIKRRLKA